MKNLPSLDDFVKLDSGDRQSLPLSVLAVLQEDIKAAEGKIKLQKKALEETLVAKYEKAVMENYRDKEEPYGSQTVVVEGGSLKCDRKKNVTWDNSNLDKIETELVKSKYNPSEFINTEKSVSETSFKAWPSQLQNFFKSARTVKAGKLSITLIPEEN